MPIGVMLTATEVEAALAAEVGTMTGNFFEYDPRETLAMAAAITETGAEGAERLVTRLADIYAKHVVKPYANRETKIEVVAADPVLKRASGNRNRVEPRSQRTS